MPQRQRSPAQIRVLLILAALVFAATFIGFSWHNSLAVRSVSIRIKQGVQEHTDHSVAAFGVEHRKPDYKVKLRVSGRLLAVDLGTRLNTSATNWISFNVTALVPLRHVQEVLIIEDDKVENDVLDRIHGQGPTREGQSFQCQFETVRSFDAGMNWFFSTPVGKAVVTAFILVVLVLVAYFFRIPL